MLRVRFQHRNIGRLVAHMFSVWVLNPTINLFHLLYAPLCLLNSRDIDKSVNLDNKWAANGQLYNVQHTGSYNAEPTNKQ